MSANDQRSVRITATGAVTTARTRLCSVYFQGAAGAGRITITDGNGGATLFDIDTPAGVTFATQVFVGEEFGIVARNGLYCSTLGATAATIFFSGGT